MIIDIHSHIIPGVDDGSVSLEDSIYMARMAVECGVTHLVATPHYNYHGCATLEQIDKAYRALIDAIEYEQIPIKIYKAMEIYASPDLPALLRDGKVLTYPDSNYFLVEFYPNLHYTVMNKLLDDCAKEGFIPIIAHPERYHTIQHHPEVVRQWKNKGYGVQLNRDSLIGSFGDKAYECALLLMRNRWANCIASDAHTARHRNTNWEDALDFLFNTFDNHTVLRLIEKNPERILHNRQIKISRTKKAESK